MIINKELFVETIEAIRKQHEHDIKCGEAFKVILPDDHISFYDNHHLRNQLIKILQIAFNDEHRDSWIEYFIWELDFGKNYHVGTASRKNGTPINLSSAASLWDFLFETKYDLNVQVSDTTGDVQGTKAG